MKTSPIELSVLLLGICIASTSAHPGAVGHSHNGGNPWYGYLPPSVLSLSTQGMASTPSDDLRMEGVLDFSAISMTPKKENSKISTISSKQTNSASKMTITQQK